MYTVGGNVDNSGRDTHLFSETKKGKASAVEGEQDVVYTKGGGSVVIFRKSVGNNLHWKIHGTVSQWVALQPIFEVCAREMGY